MDTAGLEFDGVQIKNLIADIGDTAEQTAESMHFLGTDGAVETSYRNISAAAEFLGLSIDELIQQYDVLNQEVDQNDALIEQNVNALENAKNAMANQGSMLERQIALQAEIAIYESIRQERENAVTLAENWLDNAITEHDLSQIARFANEIVSCYKEMQETIQQEADYYRSLGYADTSDEVSKLMDLWWDYTDDMKAVKQKVVDNLIDIVDAAHDAVDEIQNVLSTLKDAADEFADNGGFITVDTLQDIIKLGPEYMQYLEDENGLLVINEENINRVIAAKTQPLALENAMSYVERLRLALEEDSIEKLNQLL